MYNLPDSSILFADSSRGIYIPQHFAESIRKDTVSGVNQEQWSILEYGPNHESYWDVWCEVEQSAVVKDSGGVTYGLWQDGDLWLVPTDAQWPED